MNGVPILQKDRDADLPEQVMWQGRFITAKTRGRWEYVGRARGIRAAAIIALDDDADGTRHVILVSQYRVPLGRFSLEIPAGLVGDDAGGEGEEATTAAARELEEETGYRADRIEAIGRFASSPGMVSETFTLVRAHGLTRVGEGGGEAGEGITVYRVKLDEVPAFVAGKRAEGVFIDAKLLLVLGASIFTSA